MKKNNSTWILSVCCCLLLSSCNLATPQKYFETAVLNSNMVAGFANDGLERQLESPPAKMVAGQDRPVSIKRTEFLSTEIKFVEDSFDNIKDLKETDDTQTILEPSIKMFEYVLPVYKTEYMQLAKLYDDNASKENIAALKQSIREKYAAGFEVLYKQLIANGKLYAAKHDIKVNWNVGG